MKRKRNAGRQSSKVASVKPARSDLYVVIMDFLMHQEAKYFKKASQTEIKQWFYDCEVEKERQKENNSASNGDRIHINADAAAETFRKTYYNSENTHFTKRFLSTIVSKFEFTVPYEDWDDFHVKIYHLFRHFLDENPDFKEQCDRDQNEMKPAEITHCIISFVLTLFLTALAKGKVFVRGLPELLIVAGSEKEYYMRATSGYLHVIDALEITHYESYKLINYSKQLLYAVNPDIFFLGSTDYQLMVSCIAVIPLNKLGHMHLTTGKLFFKTITPDMIWSSQQGGTPSSFYIDPYLEQTSRSTFIGLEHTFRSLIRFILKSSPESDIEIYVANDTNQKINIITLFQMQKISPEKTVKIGLRKHNYEVKKHSPKFTYTLYKSSYENIELPLAAFS